VQLAAMNFAADWSSQHYRIFSIILSD